MNHRIKLLFDDKKEKVLREIEIASDSTLSELHIAVIKFFGLTPGELASFYKTNAQWEQLDEIPLMAMSDGQGDGQGIMSELLISDILKTKEDKLIYVYDYLNLWVFYVVVVDINVKKTKTKPKVRLINSEGKLPDKLEEKKMISEKKNRSLENDDFIDEGNYYEGENFNDESSFENIDDYKDLY